MGKKFKNTLIIGLSSILLAFGLYFFYIKHDIASGGVTGISIIFSKWFPIMTTGQWSLFLNILLVILAFILMGKKFAMNTILSSIIVSLAIMFFEKFFPNFIFSNDLLINIIFGGGIVSYSISLIFFNNASSGGTDILAAIFNKYLKMSLGMSLFIIDFLVVVMALSEFGVENALYAILAVIIQSVGLNYFIQGLGRKIALLVISDYSDEINAVILSKYNRGVTLLDSKGGFSKKRRDMILTVVPFRKYISIKEEILEIDNKAFIITQTTSEVFGEGFTYDVFD